MFNENSSHLYFFQMPRRGVPRKRAAAAAVVSQPRPDPVDSDSDPEGSVKVYPEGGARVAEHYDISSEAEPKKYSQDPQKKRFTKDGLRMLAGLHVTAERLYRNDYKVYCADEGPLIKSFRLSPVHDDDYKDWLFGQIIHLQYQCLPQKKG